MCTCPKHSVKYRIVYNINYISFIWYLTHTHMVLSCKVYHYNRDGKDAQLLVSIGHVTVSQSDPVKTQLCNALYTNLHLVSLHSS